MADSFRLLMLAGLLAGCSEDAGPPSTGGPTNGGMTASTAAGNATSDAGLTASSSSSSGAGLTTTAAGTGSSTTGNAGSMSGSMNASSASSNSVTTGMGGASSTSTAETASMTGAGGTSGTATTGGGGSGGSTSSAGCGQAPPASDRYTIDVGGETREYILAVPDDYDPNQPHRLIFGWHPLGGSAQQVAGGGYYGLQSQAGGTAIFVAPEGLPFQGNSLGWANTGGRDIAFLEAMLERFRAELCIDDNRIFSTGFSFGGMMSFAAGCAMTGQMRAIAPQAGNIQVSGCENGTRPVAVMGFHGDDDTVVSIDGGRAGRDKFIERNQCTQQTTMESGWCEGLGENNQPCSCVSYDGCAEGYPVIWCEFNGPHTPAPNSGATIWNFFAQF